MKKLLLVSAVAALSVSSAYAADVYGRVVADLRYQEDGDVTLDGYSRLGVKGSKALTPSVNGIYQLEWSAELDDNDQTANFKSRDTYLGVQGDSFGTIKAGHLLSIDDYVNYTNPSDYWKSGIQGDAYSGRVENALAYASPNYNGMTFMAMYKLTDAGGGTEGDDKDKAGSMGVAATYENGPMKVGAAYIDLKDGSHKNRMVVSGAYDISQFTVSGLYQLADFDTDDNENSYIVAGSYKVPNTKWETYVEYDAVTNKGGVKDADVDVISVGGYYDFGNGMSGRIYAGMKDDGDNDKFGVGTGLTYKF